MRPRFNAAIDPVKRAERLWVTVSYGPAEGFLDRTLGHKVLSCTECADVSRYRTYVDSGSEYD
jgi:hypothetical protein